MASSAHEKIDFMGVGLRGITVDQFMDMLIEWAGNDEGETRFATYLNAACSNIAQDDNGYRDILNSADCVYADGQAVVWASRFLGSALPHRVNAGDFIEQLLPRLAERRLRVTLVGGRPGVAAAAGKNWQALAPELDIVAVHDGFFADEGVAVAEDIGRLSPDIVLVGMGVPWQEKWVWRYRNHLNARVLWCVGALFEYYGEGRPRAPLWMRRAGLEWLFRLVQEPRRLWRRYLVGNGRFIISVLRWRFGNKRT